MNKFFLWNKKVKKTLIIILISFVVVFLLRWGYKVYFSGNDILVTYNSSTNYDYYATESVGLEGKGYRVEGNVASAKLNQYDTSGKQVLVDQKYEKTADISANTDKFAEDKERISLFIKETDAVIQTENLTGLEGSQNLYLEIGVLPDKFDTLVEKIKEVGYLDSFSVNKVDRTSEFRELMAEQKTLEKTRESYTEIKEKGGTIEELLLMETKILDVEKSLQNLSVNLGVFSTENSFCTVKFSLRETASRSISVRFVLSCAKDSFFWTLQTFILTSILIFFLLLFVCLVVFVLNYIRKSSLAKEAQPPAAQKEYPPYSSDSTDEPKKK